MATFESLKNFLREGTPKAVIEQYLSLEQIAQNQIFANLDSNVVVVDTEATGLSFTKDELIQIAAARITEGKVVDWYVTFVDPGLEISEDIEHLTHICNEDVVGAPSPDEAIKGLVEFSGNAIMLAHNVNFDKTFLTKHSSGYSLLENIWIDTLDLSRIVFPRLNSHRLIDLAKAFDVIESTHRADDDVATTCEIYRLCLAGITQMPYKLIVAIAGLASVDMWSTGYIFAEMLKILSSKNAETKNIDDFFVSSDVYDVDLFGENNSKVNAFGLLRSMRDQRSQSLPMQNKYNVALDDEEIAFAGEDAPLMPMDSMQFPTEDTIENEFSKRGLLGKIYPDFEQRNEQLTMSKEVLGAFRNSKNLVIEAGTGVGKSMAYLIPSIKIAKENQITIGVATKTNSLLDQLIYHELPAIAKYTNGLIYSSLKGSKHYICLRKVAFLTNEKAKNVTYKNEIFCNAPSIAGLLSFVEQTGYDDCDGLKINNRALPNSLYTCASHECLRHKCPFYHHGCFVHGARRMASNSDIVVTNHSMMFCDIKSNNGILPPIKYWIVDEAHNTENEARRAFSYDVTASSLLEFAKNLDSSSAKHNVFIRALRNLESIDIEDKVLIYGLINKCISSGKDFVGPSNLYANNICDLLDFSEKNANGYEFATIWINDSVRESKQFNSLYDIAKQWYVSAENLITQINNLLASIADFKNLAVSIREISAFLQDLKEILNSTDIIFFNNSEKYVYSAYINTKKTVKFDKISAEMYSVSEILNDRFYSQTHSIVFTSATLATADSFRAFKDSVGLPNGTIDCQLSSSFNYDKNMTIYVANDMPANPNLPEFSDKLSFFLAELHKAGHGSILSLFTNRRQMERAFEYVYEEIKPFGLRLLMQKWGLSVKGVKDEFLQNETLSLFALKSFWEGFDAPGSTLKGVIICKLPFARMNDPLSLERKSRESNSWFKYTLPNSIIETKQAVGRLIRKADDKGYVVFADSRLVQKPYGEKFLQSMPSKNIKIMNCNDIVDEVSKLEF